MSIFSVRTKKNSTEKGKTRVYIAQTGDTDPFVMESVMSHLVEDRDFAVYTCPLDVKPDEAFISELEKMELIVFFVTPGLLMAESRALCYELPIALQKEMKLMPVDSGDEFTDLFVTCCEHIPEDWTIEKAPFMVHRNLLISYAEMAGTFQVKGNLEKAHEWFSISERHASLLMDEWPEDGTAMDDESICLINLALNARLRKSYDEAYTYMSEALETTERLIEKDKSIGARRRKLFALRILGEISRDKKDWENCFENYERATHWAEYMLTELHDLDSMQTIPLSLSRVAESCEKMERAEEAYQAYTDAIEVYESMREHKADNEALLQEMLGVATRLVQLSIARDEDGDTDKYQELAGNYMKEFIKHEKKKIAEEEKGHGTITLPPLETK